MAIKLPPVGTTFNGRYQVDQVLGEGGFSMVFAATDSAAKRPVALKILKPDGHGYPDEVSSRFRREVKIVANLSDPHTVTMFDSGTSDDGLLYMVFEYVPGQDLSQFLAQRGGVAEGDAIHILTQVLQSLREAHRAGLLHRDIKPENIRVYEYGGDALRVKLLDFGIARPTTAEASRITRPGELVGTPRYMSPEQLLEKELTPASDLYSLGLVTMELLLGRSLLHGNAWSDQVDRLKDGHVFELPGTHIGPLLRRIVLRMCARQPDDRYPTADAVLHDLGFQLSSDSLRRSALNDLVERAPTAQRLDVSSDAFSQTPTPDVATPSDESSFEAATTRRETRGKWRDSADGAPPKRQRGGLNPLHVIIALLFGAIAALAAVLFVIWPREQTTPPDKPPDTRAVPFVKPAEPTAPTAVVAPPAPQGDVGVAQAEDLAEALVPAHATRGCGRNEERRGLINVDAVKGLAKASHIAYLPRGYDPDTPHPVVFLFHDAGQPPEHNITSAGFAELADDHGIVLLAPQGEETFDGTGLWLSVWEGDGALAPALALWDAAAEELCLDRSRVFAVGHAAGGYAAHKMACRFPLAALAMNGHVKVTTDRACQPRPPVPTLVLIGRTDGYSPREGGANCLSANKLSWKQVDQRWKRFNGCTGGPTTFIDRDDGRCMKWACKTPYARCDLDGGREWPGTRPMIWDRFNRNCGGYPGSFPSVETIWEFFDAAPHRNLEDDP